MSLYEIIERNLYFTELSSTEIIGIICVSEFVVRLFKVEAKLETVQLPLLLVNLKQSVESNAINAEPDLDQLGFA